MAVIGTVVAIIGAEAAGGSASLVTETGKQLLLKLNDTVQPSDTIITPKGVVVELQLVNGKKVLISAEQTVKVTQELADVIPPSADDSAIDLVTVQTIITAIKEGKDINEVLEETAAGLNGGISATNYGFNFVNLLRITQGLAPLSFEQANEGILQREIEAFGDDNNNIIANNANAANAAAAANAAGTTGAGGSGTNGGGTGGSGTPTISTVEAFGPGVGDNNVNEGSNLVFNVGINGTSTGPVTYSLSLTDGTATGGVGNDYNNVLTNASFTNGVTYNASTNSITVPAGVTSFTVTVPTFTDSVSGEPIETLNLSVGGVTGTGGIIDTTNNPPVVDLDANNSTTTGTGFVTSFTENGAGVSIADTDVSVTDVDDTNIEGATITLTNFRAGDVLSAVGLPAGITASAYNPATGVITLTGTASLAQYQAAIRAITFNNTSDNPDTTARIVNVVVNDGNVNSNVAVTTINVIPQPDAPIAVTDNYTMSEDGAAITLTPLTGDSDPDGTTPTIQSINGVSMPALGTAVTIPVTGGIVNVSTTGVITFTPAANFNGTVTFPYVITDGTTTATANQIITVNPVNDAPVLDLDADNSTVSGTEYDALYFENGAPVSIADTDISITDVDDTNIESARVVFFSPEPGDVLTVGTLPPGISFTTSTDGSGNFVINLNGTATLAQYQAAIRAITFSSTSENPSTVERTITVTVNDGNVNSNTAISTITVIPLNDAPVLDLDANNSTATGTGYVTSFTENGAAVSIADTDVSVTDVDDTNIEGATITLTNFRAGDVLSAVGLPSGITASAYNSATGVITLTGTATLAQYQTAIRAIRFNNTTDNPDTTARVVNVVVNDGSVNSNVAVTTINVTAVNDTPTIAPNSGIAVTEDVATKLTGLSFGDVDAGAGNITVTLSVPAGSLSAISGAGVTVGGTATALTLTGTLSAINTFVSSGTGVSYTTALNANGTVNLSINVNDNGNTGVDPSLTGTATNEQANLVVPLNITAQNDGPVAVADVNSITEPNPATFYYVDSAGNVGTMSPVSGVRTVIGATGRVFGDIAVTNTGQLYGVDQSNNSLYTINATTGASTLVGGTTGATAINSLVSDASGNLYGASGTTGQLYSINKATGAATLLGSFGAPSSGDLLFLNGALYLSTTTNQLVKFDLATQTTTVAASLPANTFNLAQDSNGVFYAITNTGAVHTVNLATGTTTATGTTSSGNQLLGIASTALNGQFSSVGGDVTPGTPGQDSDVDSTFTVTGAAAGTLANTSGGVGTTIVGIYGNVVINADGTYTYQLDSSRQVTNNLTAGQVAQDVFSYTITDTSGATSTTTLTINVTGSADFNASTTTQVISGTAMGLNGEYYGYNDVAGGGTRQHTDDGTATFGNHLAAGNLNSVEDITAIVNGRNALGGGTSNLVGTSATAANNVADVSFRVRSFDYGFNPIVNSSLGSNSSVAAGSALPVGDNTANSTTRALSNFLDQDRATAVVQTGAGNAAGTSGLGTTTDVAVRVSGKFYVDPGVYDFRVTADDGFRFNVDGKTLLEFDGNQSPTVRIFNNVQLGNASGGLQDIEMLYWEQGGNAQLRVEYKLSSDPAGSYRVMDLSNMAMFRSESAPVLTDTRIQDLVYDTATTSWFIRTGSVLDGSAGGDVMNGGAGRDYITGAAGNDTINGGASSDYLDGGANNDSINGGAGSDTIIGGAGADTLIGGLGDDTYILSDLDAITEVAGQGTDTVVLDASYVAANVGSNANLGFYANIENLTAQGTANINLTGTAANNRLEGNVANNSISGGDGNDFLIGAAGNDTLTGGNGSDTFAWYLADKGASGAPASDVITGFNYGGGYSNIQSGTAGVPTGGGDVLDLRDLLQGERTTSGNSGSAASNVEISNLLNYIDVSVSGADTVIRISSTGGFAGGAYNSTVEDERITLQGVNLYTATGVAAGNETLLLQTLIQRGTLIVD